MGFILYLIKNVPAKFYPARIGIYKMKYLQYETNTEKSAIAA